MMLLQTVPNESAKPLESKIAPSDDTHTHHVLDYAPAPGWTVHVTSEGRLYYCNHVTRTAGWLPPAEAWRYGEEALPYGWERAIDNTGRPYYINHLNKTTTYETPVVRHSDPSPAPEPRPVTLERSPVLGFGFVAGSEKPVIVRFVTEGGPSVDKLLPGDQILSVNGEDVKKAPREHVISLVRACSKTVELIVCQPPEQQGIRKSTLLSASKRARLRSKPSRVRFAESVCVNGAPLFPPSAFSLGDLCVAPMANVLKVFLENGQTKSFKYDAWTTVKDVVTSLEIKLCLQASEHFSLVVEHIKSLKRNKLTLLNPKDTLTRIASRPGAHKLRCLFRVAFVPSSSADLAQKDLNAFDYLYTQCCNDVIQERFAPELQYDTALRLAALHIYQHALVNNIPGSKLTIKTIEREFGLERFVPASLLENIKQKEVRKLLGHFLKLHSNMAGQGKQLTVLQAKLHYLDIVSQLPSYGAKCFSAGPKGDAMERVILVSPKFGISQITGTRNSMPVPISNIEEMRQIEVRSDDEVSRTILIRLQDGKVISITLEERDASELILVLRGYYRLATSQILPLDEEDVPTVELDLAPPYLSQHRVVPEKWSYTNQNAMKTTSFTMPPLYQIINKKTNGLYNTMGRQSKPNLMMLDLDSNMNNSYSNRNHHFSGSDLQSVVSMEILESRRNREMDAPAEIKNEQVLKRVKEMQQLVENSEKYLTEQENLERLQLLSEWQETSVDVESDSDSVQPDDAPGKLKHSDSLLLLNKSHLHHQSDPSAAGPGLLNHAGIELLRSESVQTESDNESLYSPHESPSKATVAAPSSRISFGMHSSHADATENDLIDRLRNGDVYDVDLIDLTLLPPPATPDELDGALPTPINVPPRPFADSIESLNDLEEFLAKVSIQPPIQKVTPAIELTPEEIMSYIIPPPPKSVSDSELHESSPESATSHVIEYATIERKGPFSCCSKGSKSSVCKDCPTASRDKKNDSNNVPAIRLPPRRSSEEKPPDRPPKNISPVERQRSHSLTNPPKLPPRGEAPPHLFLPPKKPPLPPVPSLDVLRQKKSNNFIVKHHGHGSTENGDSCGVAKTAGIGSPYLQRNRNLYYGDLEGRGDDGAKEVYGSLHARHATAVSTPTSPHLGRGAHQLTVVPMLSPDCAKSVTFRPPLLPKPQDASIIKNGCTSTQENLLSKTNVAMGGLLARLDQVALQCNAAQVHGGGRLLSEEKFQSAKEELTSQSLQLVTSSKMLVIAMSDPSLPDLPENLAICLTILRRLTELCQDLTNHTTAPLQTRNLILKVRDVIAAFRHLITSDIDRSSLKTIEDHLAAQAEQLAIVLATLLRSLRVFSP